MSLQYNDTTTYKGIVQIYEKEIGANRGDISGNVEKLKEFTADCNLAIDDITNIALKSSGTWNFDDSNYDDYPIIKTDLVSGQRDYTFLTDEDGALVLDIFKVVIFDGQGYGKEAQPVDAQETQNNFDVSNFYNGQNAVGTPTRYDKTANGLLLDVIPNYTTDGENTGIYGLEVYINREASYFLYTDTTKKPGFPGIFHKYLALKPALDYARRNNLAVLPRLEQEIMKLEGDESRGILGSIARYFGRRERDIKRKMTPIREDTR